MITLRSGDMHLDLLPELGGAVAALSFRGQDLLRRAPNGTRDPIHTACFPLVPFANRIEEGEFRFGGRHVRLARNFGDHAHPLHGQGWQSRWRIESVGAAKAVLAFDYVAGDWPWAYTAQQVFTLSDDGLRIELSARNNADEPMPVSLGFHPYFTKLGEARLTADTDSVWLSSDTQIPTTKSKADHLIDLARGVAVSKALFVDHCHTGWRGEAIVELPAQQLRLELSASKELRFLHVFIPQGESYFCAEPVTAMPNAVNRSDERDDSGLRSVAPGATFAVWMNLDVTRTA